MIDIQCYTHLDSNRQIIKAITDSTFTYSELPNIGAEIELKTNLCNFYNDYPFLVISNSPIVSSYIVACLVGICEAEIIFIAPDQDSLPILIWDIRQNAEGTALI